MLHTSEIRVGFELIFFLMNMLRLESDPDFSVQGLAL